MNAPIREHMTAAVWTIGQDASLVTARAVMNEHNIRHLPVLHGGQLVGLVSQRDIQLLESLEDVDPKEVTVEEAMSQDVLVVAPSRSLAEVARRMAEHKYGSAVIVEDGRLRGIFTTVDALRSLDSLLSVPKPQTRTGKRKRPSGPSRSRHPRPRV